VLAAFGDGQIFWSFLVFFFWIIWIWLAITVFVDIFRSRDLSGVGKMVWVVLVVLVPYLGVFAYLLLRGGRMHERAVEAAQAQDKAFRQYVQDAAGNGSSGNGHSTAEELSRLADLKDRGVITDAEFERLKAKAVG
jgi:putative oligomerization/nucleic acid binding protein/phospholipase D-like protein